MSNEPPPPGQPPEDDPLRKPPPPPGGGGPYDAGGGGPYDTGGGPPGYGGTDPLAGMPPLGDTGRRVLARFLDWLIIFVPLALIGIPLDIYNRVTEDDDLSAVWSANNDGGQWAFQALSIAAYLAYDTYMTAKRNGQTVGKKLMGLRVAMLNDGTVPPVSAALIRALVLWLPALICCACLWPLLLLILIVVDKPYKQGLHDKAAKTVVVSTTQ